MLLVILLVWFSGRQVFDYVNKRDAEIRIQSATIESLIHFNEIDELRRRIDSEGLVRALKGDVEGTLFIIMQHEEYVQSGKIILLNGGSDLLNQDAIDRLHSEASRWRNDKALELLTVHGLKGSDCSDS